MVQALEIMQEALALDPALDSLTEFSGANCLLTLAAKSVAVEEIQKLGEDPRVGRRQLRNAENLVAEGDALLAAGDILGAAEKFKEAQREVQGVENALASFSLQGESLFGCAAVVPANGTPVRSPRAGFKADWAWMVAASIVLLWSGRRRRRVGGPKSPAS